MMRLSRPMLLSLTLTLLVAGCGGGGTGSSSGGSGVGSGSVPTVTSPTATPAPGTTAAPVAPGATPTPVPGAPAATPTPVPVTPTAAPTAGATITNSSSAAIPLADSDAGAVGQIDQSTVISARTTNAALDAMPCNHVENSTLHFHVHVSIFVNGTQIAVPTAIGIFHAIKTQDPFFYDVNGADPTSCVYATHTHAADGVFHIATATATEKFVFAQILDVWGWPLTTSGFGPYSGPTRVFKTDESFGGPGQHPVTEITGTDFGSLFITNHLEFTIEVGTPVNTPNYTFGTGV